MYFLGILFGSLEIFFIVFLFVLMITGNIFGYVLFIIYTIYTFYIGNTFLKFVITAISSFLLAFIFLNFGFWISVLAFLLMMIIFEFLPRFE